MNAVPSDTLNMARKLQASGVDVAVAAGMVEALVDALNGGDVAIRADVAGIAAAIDSLRIETAGRHTELKTEIAVLHTQLKTDNELLQRDIVIKLSA